MVSARAENIPTSPDSLLFNLAADWIMRDLANGLEDPRFPKKLHEAFWWGNIRWAIILAVGATGVAVAANEYLTPDSSVKVLPQPQPQSSPVATQETLTLIPTATKEPTSTPKPTETLVFPTPTKAPTFTPFPSDTPMRIVASPTKFVITPLPLPTREAPPPVNLFEGWVQVPDGPDGQITSPIALTTIDPACFQSQYEFKGFNNFTSTPDSIIDAIDIHNPPTQFLYRCVFYKNTLAVDVYGP